jgi:hypothetical protein
VLWVLILVVGCGDTNDDSFPPIPSQVTNTTLEGLYNLINTCYSTRLPVETPRIYSGDITFNLATILNPRPRVCKNTVEIVDYEFKPEKLGLGTITVERSIPGTPLVTGDYMTDLEGGMAIYSVPFPQVTTPILGVQLKAQPSEAGDLKMEDFHGLWGLVSLDLRGHAVAAELALTSTSGVGSVVGVGFESVVSGTVSPILRSVQGSASVTGVLGVSLTYSLNLLKDKLVFLGNNWFVKNDATVAMASSVVSSSADRLSFLVRPSLPPLNKSFEGKFEIFQWSTFSFNFATSTQRVNISSLPLADVVRRGSMEFSNGTVALDGFLGPNCENIASAPTTLSCQRTVFQVEPGTTFMHSLWLLDSRAVTRPEEQQIRFRFFMSLNRRYLFGVDYDNDFDRRTTLVIGIRTTPN